MRCKGTKKCAKNQIYFVFFSFATAHLSPEALSSGVLAFLFLCLTAALLLECREIFLTQHERLRQVVLPHYLVGGQLLGPSNSR